MTISLFAPARPLLAAVAQELQREGLTPKTYYSSLQPNTPPPSQLVSSPVNILLLPPTNEAAVGEAIVLVRTWLGEGPVLLVCTTEKTAQHRKTLYACGATKLITPADWEAPDVAERVLGQLIIDGHAPCAESGLIMRGITRVMRELYAHLSTLAPLDEPVLLLGETGTGKSLAAQELHNRRNGQGRDFVHINCPEISAELLPSELFGHERGSFTDAVKARQGLLVAAGKGTVFLDEIGELDLPSQAKLLRAIEERKVRPVGSNAESTIEARIVMATNRDLRHEVRVGRFRADLFQRMQGFTLYLPPLRQRKADIPLLVDYFIEAYCKKYDRKLTLPEGSLDCLFNYNWPGNVRELQQTVLKAAAYSGDSQYVSRIVLEETVSEFRTHLFDSLSPPTLIGNQTGKQAVGTPFSLDFDPTKETWKDFEARAKKAYFEATLAMTHGKKKEAEKLSGVSHGQFFAIIKAIGIDTSGNT